jgi:hypothetical protein
MQASLYPVNHRLTFDDGLAGVYRMLSDLHENDYPAVLFLVAGCGQKTTADSRSLQVPMVTWEQVQWTLVV